MSGKLKFEAAVTDVAAAQRDQEYHLEVFDVEGQEYAAVRPVEGAFLNMVKLAYGIKQNDRDKMIGVIQFLDLCMDPEDLTAALIESGQYEPGKTDPDDAELNEAGLELADSNDRIYRRIMTRDDVVGPDTLCDVMIGLVERWSGNPTGSPQDYLPGRKSTGRRSTGKPSSKGSTSRGSTAKAPAASAPRSTRSRRAASTS